MYRSQQILSANVWQDMTHMINADKTGWLVDWTLAEENEATIYCGISRLDFQ